MSSSHDAEGVNAILVQNTYTNKSRNDLPHLANDHECPTKGYATL